MSSEASGLPPNLRVSSVLPTDHDGFDLQGNAARELQTAEDAHRNLDAQRVHKAMDTLTEAQRSAVELAYFGGYSHREVAAMLQLPLGTAKTRIRDGLIRLRDTLGIET